MNTRIRQFVYLFILLIGDSLLGQVILTEIMYRPDTQVAYTEYVEIYNLSDSTVDLNGWKIGDSLAQDNIINAGEGLRLAPRQYGLILDAGYFENSTIYDSLIPPDALLLTIDAGSFGSHGFSNSVAEPVILLNQHGDTVQVYKYSLGNAPGYSDEKIHLIPDNSPDNWADGKTFRGTPGFENSVFVQSIDLSVNDFHVSGSKDSANEVFHFQAIVENVGLEPVNTVNWKTFIDNNGNSLPDEDEINGEGKFEEEILPGDSIFIEGDFLQVPTGEVVFGFYIENTEDKNLENNIKLYFQYVAPAYVPVCINEIMARPIPDAAEWVELFNYGDDSLDLRYLFFTDGRDTTRVSREAIQFLPGSYVILAGDSTFFHQYASLSAPVFVSSHFPALNNNFDDLTLFLDGGRVVDHVRYTADWYGREVEPGTSLEKINPRLNGNLQSSWAASVSSSGSTPGERNSVWVETLPEVARLQIHPNPFSPDFDGYEDFTVISFEVPVETAFARIRIFDIRGRLIKTLASVAPVAHQGRFIWDGKDDSGRVARIGAYVCLVEILNSEKQVSRQLRKTIFLYKR